jgi:hypothetical protein
LKMGVKIKWDKYKVYNSLKYDKAYYDIKRVRFCFYVTA